MLKALAIVGVTALVAIGGHRQVADAAGPSAAGGSGVAVSQVATAATVMPGTVAPGAHITVFDDADCSKKSGTAMSVAFAGPVRLTPVDDVVGGSGRIRRGMNPGTYKVTLSCGHDVTTSVTVAPAGSTAADGSVVAAADQAAPPMPDNKRVTTGFVVVASTIALMGYALRHRRFFRKSEA